MLRKQKAKEEENYALQLAAIEFVNGPRRLRMEMPNKQKLNRKSIRNKNIL